MSVTLAVVTDGRRELLQRTIISALAHLDGPIDARVIYDDTADTEHFAWLNDLYRPLGFDIIGGVERRGFGGAIRYTWRTLRGFDSRWVFWLEDDFTFNQPINLAAMAHVLDTNPQLAQLALRRQPWNSDEHAAGGIVEQHPDDFADCRDGYGNEWLEHRRFFTTNPNLFPRSLCDRDWPDTKHSEGIFTHQLLADGYRFAYWGSRASGEWVKHTGTQRAGTGY